LLKEEILFVDQSAFDIQTYSMCQFMFELASIYRHLKYVLKMKDKFA